MPKPKSKVAAYVRVSLEGRQTKGLDSQERAIRDYLKNHGMEATYYRDEVGAGSLERPAFKRLQNDIFQGKVNVVVCWKLDRLSRSLKDGVNVLSGWLERDVRVVAVAQQLDFAGPVGQLVASVLFAIAAMERENIRENTRRGMAAAAARGVKIGKRPKLFAKDFVPLLESGMSTSECARQCGVTRQGLLKAAKRESVDIKGLIQSTKKRILPLS